MSTWVEKPLGEIADLAGGVVRTGPFGAQLHQHDYVDGGAVAVVMPKDMASGKVRFDSIARIDDRVAEGLAEHRLLPGDIVLARRGDVGRAAWVDASDGPLLCGTGSMRIHLPVGDVLPRFLHYYLQTNAAIGWLQGQAVGATMPNLNGAIVRALPIVYPDMVTQVAIVETLDSIEHLIENNRRRIELLEEIAQAIYREWFVQLRYPGHEHDELVDSTLGPIPAGWTVTSLGEAGRWLSGGTPRTNVPEYWDGEIPWITSGSLTSMLLDRSDRRITQLGLANGTRLVPRNTLLFVVRGMSLVREFRVGIADVPVAFGQDCKAIIAGPGLHPLYLGFTVISMTDQIQSMVELAGHGTGKLSTDRLKEISLPEPPEDLQAKFVAIAGPIRDSVSYLRNATDRLVGIRDLLLPRLVTGKIDLSR